MTLRFFPYNVQGRFEGDPTQPSRLIFTDEYLAPVDGGMQILHASFTAVLVPEPDALAVLALGLGTMMAWRKNRCHT